MTLFLVIVNLYLTIAIGNDSHNRDLISFNMTSYHISFATVFLVFSTSHILMVIISRNCDLISCDCKCMFLANCEFRLYILLFRLCFFWDFIYHNLKKAQLQLHFWSFQLFLLIWAFISSNCDFISQNCEIVFYNYHLVSSNCDFVSLNVTSYLTIWRYLIITTTFQVI